mmetsp:Transcript_142197/g.453854  ORF Transcript_142197/g.453854 Transcript_142197/m.453854 type:complete len:260 (-) Transcript_142197:193-972(-)
MNPNNTQGSGRGSGSSVALFAAATDAAHRNHSNQKNPNNPQYWSSRGYPERPSSYEIEIAERKADGAFQHHAQMVAASRPKLRPSANEAVQQVIQQVVPRAELRKQGSRAKGTDTDKSDYDFHLRLPDGQTLHSHQREKFVQLLQSDPRISNARAGHAAIKFEDDQGVRGEIMPSRASYHDKGVVKEKPDAFFINNAGACNAVRYVKGQHPEVKGHVVEKIVKDISERFGYDRKSDPAGRKRAEEAEEERQRYLSTLRS